MHHVSISDLVVKQVKPEIKTCPSNCELLHYYKAAARVHKYQGPVADIWVELKDNCWVLESGARLDTETSSSMQILTFPPYWILATFNLYDRPVLTHRRIKLCDTGLSHTATPLLIILQNNIHDKTAQNKITTAPHPRY